MTRGRRAASIAVLVTVGLGVVLWTVGFASPVFDVRSIHVRGNVRLSTAEVTDLTGDLEGRNLLTLALGDVRESVLRSPWIAKATVDRSLPSTVRIDIEERRPTAWAIGPSAGAVVAADGTVLEHRSTRPGSLVSLGPIDALPAPGERIEAPELDVVVSLTPSVRRQVVRADSRGRSVVLRLSGGGRVLYGVPNLLAEKSAALTPLLGWVAERGVAVDYIDVRAPATPAIRPVRRA